MEGGKGGGVGFEGREVIILLSYLQRMVSWCVTGGEG